MPSAGAGLSASPAREPRIRFSSHREVLLDQWSLGLILSCPGMATTGANHDRVPGEISNIPPGVSPGSCGRRKEEEALGPGGRGHDKCPSPPQLMRRQPQGHSRPETYAAGLAAYHLYRPEGVGRQFARLRKWVEGKLRNADGGMPLKLVTDPRRSQAHGETLIADVVSKSC